MDKWVNWLKALCIAALVSIIGLALVFINSFIGMYIDHQCYQLEPNENYSHTICERYWNK